MKKKRIIFTILFTVIGLLIIRGFFPITIKKTTTDGQVREIHEYINGWAFLEDKYRNLVGKNIVFSKGHNKGKQYAVLGNGTYLYNGHTYINEFEVSCKNENTWDETVYVYLSNIGTISFDEARDSFLGVGSTNPLDAVAVDVITRMDVGLVTFSGSFTAIVTDVIPDYCTNPGNSVAVVHFFQCKPFLIDFGEDMTGKFEKNEYYTFEFEPFTVEVLGNNHNVSIENFDSKIKVVSYRPATENEKGVGGADYKAEYKQLGVVENFPSLLN